MKTLVFRSRVDWWLWAVLAFALTVVIVCYMSLPWWLTLISCTGILLPFVLSVWGTWYAIDEESGTLIVYQLFRANRYPIAKIRDVRLTKGYLSGPALSARRISIRFTDRSVLRSLLPLEISPKDREGFVSRLMAINPDISVF